MERDRQVTEALQVEGWVVLRFWEWQIKRHLDSCVETVLSSINKRKDHGAVSVDYDKPKNSQRS